MKAQEQYERLNISVRVLFADSSLPIGPVLENRLSRRVILLWR